MSLLTNVILSLTQFSFTIDLNNFATVTTSFVTNNIVVLPTTNLAPPAAAYVRTLFVICFTRFNSNNVTNLKTVQSNIDSFGIPFWYPLLYLLVPLNKNIVRGPFVINLSNLANDVTLYNTYMTTFQQDLINIRTFYLQGNLDHKHFDIMLPASKNIDLNIYLNSSDLSKLTTNVYYTSFSGFERNYSWLFCLAFKLTTVNLDTTGFPVRDIQQFMSTGYWARLDLANYNNLLNNILFWYFSDGRSLRPKSLTDLDKVKAGKVFPKQTKPGSEKPKADQQGQKPKSGDSQSQERKSPPKLGDSSEKSEQKGNPTLEELRDILKRNNLLFKRLYDKLIGEASVSDSLPYNYS